MTISGQISDRKVVASAMPVYSDAARKARWEGVVAVHFTVLPDGRVKDDMYFDQTSAHRDLNRAAMDAVEREFRFEPLGRSGPCRAVGGDHDDLPPQLRRNPDNSIADEPEIKGRAS